MSSPRLLANPRQNRRSDGISGYLTYSFSTATSGAFQCTGGRGTESEARETGVTRPVTGRRLPESIGKPGDDREEQAPDPPNNARPLRAQRSACPIGCGGHPCTEPSTYGQPRTPCAQPVRCSF